MDVPSLMIKRGSISMGRGSRYVWTCRHWWLSVAVFPSTEDQGMDGHAVTGDQAWQYFHGQDRGSRYGWTCYPWWSSVSVFPWAGDQGIDGGAVTGGSA